MSDKERLISALKQGSGTTSDFDLNPDVVLPLDRRLRPAGVLVPLLDRPGGAQVVLTKRSSALKHHPGQIAFPGGKQEKADVDVTAAALREAQEEVGLSPDAVEVLGTLPTHETVTGFVVTPVLGWIREAFDPKPEPGEVGRSFFGSAEACHQSRFVFDPVPGAGAECKGTITQCRLDPITSGARPPEYYVVCLIGCSRDTNY